MEAKRDTKPERDPKVNLVDINGESIVRWDAVKKVG